jgi:hypothetical protein
MLKVYVDMLNVTQDMVQLSAYMVNVSHDIQVFMDMEHVSYGMLYVPHVKLKYIWTGYKSPNTWYMSPRTW